MAIVKEYKIKDGPVIKINDAAYRDNTSEQMEAIKKRVNEVASELLYKQYQSMCK